MKKSSLALVTCICLFAYPTIAYAETPEEMRSQLSNTLSNTSSNTGATKSKKQLAQEVLVELNIGGKYDLHLKSVVDMATGATAKPQFRTWLHKTLAEFAGWKHVNSEYVTRLEANFSEIELQELLEIAKRPLMKKLLRAEIQAYADTSEKRLRLFQKFWDDYNSGLIDAPKNLP